MVKELKKSNAKYYPKKKSLMLKVLFFFFLAEKSNAQDILKNSCRPRGTKLHRTVVTLFTTLHLKRH